MVAHFFKKKVLLNHGFWEVLNIREQDLKGNDDEHDGDGDGDGDDDDEDDDILGPIIRNQTIGSITPYTHFLKDLPSVPSRTPLSNSLRSLPVQCLSR
jgi:hypothetical protein